MLRFAVTCAVGVMAFQAPAVAQPPKKGKDNKPAAPVTQVTDPETRITVTLTERKDNRGRPVGDVTATRSAAARPLWSAAVYGDARSLSITPAGLVRVTFGSKREWDFQFHDGKKVPTGKD